MTPNTENPPKTKHNCNCKEIQYEFRKELNTLKKQVQELAEYNNRQLQNYKFKIK